MFLQDFAEPFGLWECQLAIVHCAGHQDPPLVQNLWENILDEELRKSQELPVGSRLAMLSNKVKALGKIYCQAKKYFPIGKK